MGASGTWGDVSAPGGTAGDTAVSQRSRHLSARSGGPAARQARCARAAGGVCAWGTVNYTGISTNCEGYKALGLSENQLIYKKTWSLYLNSLTSSI